MTTIHNHRKFCFNVYSHKVDSIVPQHNMKEGGENPFYVYASGGNRDKDVPECWYYEHTDEPNGVEIVIETKKHHRQQYIDAVKSQLLYFDNVKFSTTTGGVSTPIEVKVPILYEDQFIVLSDNNQYSRPHLLINKVSYGLIDFKELELEDKQGNIGIKVNLDEVSVNPSRESVIWDDFTRATVLKRFNDVVGVATDMVGKELDNPDFLAWLRGCCSISSAYTNSNSVLGRLSRIIDTNELKPAFKPIPSIRYTWRILSHIGARTFKINHVVKVNKKVKEIERDVSSTADMSSLPVLIMFGNASSRRDKYLLRQIYTQGFVVIPVKTKAMSEEGEVVNQPLDEINITAALMESADEMKLGGKQGNNVPAYLDYLSKVETALLASMQVVIYESIEVPEGWEEDAEEEEIITDTATSGPSISNAERRKVQGKTVLFTPRVDTDYSSKFHRVQQGSNAVRVFEWQKLEVPMTEIDTWQDPEVFYGTDTDATVLQMAAFISRPKKDLREKPVYDSLESTRVYGCYPSNARHCGNFFGNPDVKLIKVARDNVKYYTDFCHIHKFFQKMKGKTLTMSNKLIQWNTARLIHENLWKVRFLRGFTRFNPAMVKAYMDLDTYHDAHYREIEKISQKDYLYGLTEASATGLKEHCDKVMQFQLFVRQSQDTEAIATLAQQLFNPDQGVEIVDGCSIEIGVYDKLQEVLDYGAPLAELLNQMPVLVSPNGSLSEEFEREVRNLMDWKQVL